VEKNVFTSRRKGEGSVKEAIEESFKKIKSGDQSAREKLIDDFRPFVLKIVSRMIDKYVEPENSEEYSIALLAFNEAIEKYDANKSSNFLVFSEQVIKRRLIDYKRQVTRNKNVYPFSYFDRDNEVFEGSISFDYQYSQQLEQIEFIDEMSSFKKLLNIFGISLGELVSSTPKHRDSRELSIEIARIIANNDELYMQLNKKRRLPVKELLKLVKVSRRTIERNKKYIIAVSLILKSNLEIFKEYSAFKGEGGAGK
jgi:RNA polymerase sigma factor